MFLALSISSKLRSRKFSISLALFAPAFKATSTNLLELEEFTFLGGDFNICPKSLDVADKSLLGNDAIYTTDVKNLYKNIINLGYYDSFRSINPDDPGFTYWDYGQSFKNDIGVRIDHFLISPYALDILDKIYVDKEPRAWDKPSDHTPLVLEIEI